MAVFVHSNTTHGPLSEQMAAKQGRGNVLSNRIRKMSELKKLSENQKMENNFCTIPISSLAPLCAREKAENIIGGAELEGEGEASVYSGECERDCYWLLSHHHLDEYYYY